MQAFSCLHPRILPIVEDFPIRIIVLVASVSEQGLLLVYRICMGVFVMNLREVYSREAVLLHLYLS